MQVPFRRTAGALPGFAVLVLAASMTDLLGDETTLAAARAEFRTATAGKPYVSPLAKDAVPKTY